MMPTHTTFTMGGVQGGEVTMITAPFKIRRGSFPTIYLHPAGQTNANFMQNGYAQAALQQHMARELGTPCVAALMGGDVFANDTGMARIDATLAYINTLYGTAYTKAHLIGMSMGGAMGLRYAALNPTKVASYTGIMPLTDIITAYNTDAGGLRASIGTAWGVAYPTPLPAGADLEAQAPLIAAAKIPTQYFYSNADAIIPPAETLQMAALTGGQAYDVGNQGHTEFSMYNTFFYGKGNGKALSDFAKAAQ